MIDQKVSEMNRWFDEKTAMCSKRNHVFRTVLSVAVKTGNGDEDAVKGFFVQRAEQIPAGWGAALEKAREHNDIARMQTEQIKLDTIHEIRAEFARIWEGAE